MSSVKTFAHNIVWNNIQNILLLGVGFLTTLFAARLLGPELLGKFSILMSIIAILILITSLGFNSIITVKIPGFTQKINFSGIRSYILRKIFSIRIILILCVIAVVYYFRGLSLNAKQFIWMEDYLFVGLFIFTFQSINELFHQIYFSQMQVKRQTIVKVSEKLCALFLMLILLSMYKLGISGYLYAILIGSLLALTLNLHWTKSLLSIRPNPVPMREMYKLGFTKWVISIAGFSAAKYIAILISSFFKINSADIACYHIGFEIFRYLTFFHIGFGTVAQVFISKRYAENAKDICRIWRDLFKISIFLTVPFHLFFLINANEIVRIVFGAEYSLAAGLLRLFLLFHLLSLLLGTNLWSPLMAVTGKLKELMIFNVGKGLLALVLYVFFIPRFQMTGAAMATGVSMLLMAVYALAMIIFHFKIVPPFLYMIKIYTIYIIAALPCLFIRDKGISELIILFLLYGVFALALIKIFRLFGQREAKLAAEVNTKIGAVFSFLTKSRQKS